MYVYKYIYIYVYKYIYNETHIYQFQPGRNHKIRKQQHKHGVSRYPPMKHLLGDHKDRANMHENNQKLYDEMGHTPLNLKENQ